MIAKTLIDIARNRLGDEKKQRWTDQRLLQIVNQGQADICKLTGIYRKEAYIALANGEYRYRLPNDCMTVRRFEYRDKIINVLSRDDIDNNSLDAGEFVALKDNLPMGVVDVYPTTEGLESDVVVIKGGISSDIFTLSDPYGVVTDVSEGQYDIAPLYGVVAGLDITLADEELSIWGELSTSPEHEEQQVTFEPDVYGVTTEVEYNFSTDPKLFGFITDSDVYQVVGQYGVVTSVAPMENTLRVYYEAVPTDLYDDSTMLVIPDMWEDAMLRYLVGTALQDDNDAGNIQRGELELQKYTAQVLKARELSSKDFSGGTKKKYHTRFRRV